MSDVISNFRFEGYKVDRIKYETIPDLQFLKTTGTLAPEGWIFEIAMRQPLFLKKEKKYGENSNPHAFIPISKVHCDINFCSWWFRFFFISFNKCTRISQKSQPTN